jgi:hypothetical protein
MLGMLMAFSHRNARDKMLANRPLNLGREPHSSLNLEAVE